MLGVTVQPVTAGIARLGLDSVHGALVNSVQPGSAAEQAGVRRGDVITALNAAAIRDGNMLRNEVARMQPGSDVQVTVLRDGRERTLTARLGELRIDRAAEDESRGAGDTSGFGMSLEPLTPDAARQLGVRATSGLVVTNVQPGGRAAAAGLRAGDVIEEVDRTKVDTVDALSPDLLACCKSSRAGATMSPP